MPLTTNGINLLEYRSHGEVAQLGERCVRNAEVGSSILLFSTNYRSVTVLNGWRAIQDCAVTRRLK